MTSEFKKVISEVQSATSSESLSDSKALCEKYLERYDRPELWMAYADILLKSGEQTIARAILRNIVHRIPNIHIKDIITAGVPYTKVVVVDSFKWIYFPIPKCASSTIKDWVSLIFKNQLFGEASHSQIGEFYRVVSFSELREKYADYEKVAVHRPAMDRVRSYFHGNIDQRKSLLKESRGKATYFGLTTNPDYEFVLDNFSNYRSVFHDFRHHTDSLVGYCGYNNRNLDRVYRMEDLDALRIDLSERSGVELPVLHNMKGAEATTPAKIAEKEEAVRERFFEAESRFWPLPLSQARAGQSISLA